MYWHIILLPHLEPHSIKKKSILLFVKQPNFAKSAKVLPNILKGGTISVKLTSCLTGLEMCVCAVQNSVQPAQKLGDVAVSSSLALFSFYEVSSRK